MYLDYIKIINFRPYYGDKNEISFGFNDEKNITVILADNGSGKTSLVNALSWGLYGEELHDVRDKSEIILNHKAAFEAENSDKSVPEVIVEVHIRFYSFVDGVKKYFKVTRKSKFQKFGDNDWMEELNNSVTVDDSDKGPLTDDEAEIEIRSKIPKDMFGYFFFNGTTLSKYFKNESEDINLKKSIENISQLDLINDVSDHLTGTHDALTKKMRKLKISGRDYDGEINNKLNKKAELKKKRQKNEPLLTILLVKNDGNAFEQGQSKGCFCESASAVYQRRETV